jgi:nicotinate-nucleotide adenylyltransferase
VSGRVVIFGGTFDPIHLAHLVLAECAADLPSAGEVLFVPAARPPHKREDHLSEAADREEMVRLAIEGNRRFRLSRTELDRGGPSFAIDTIREVARASGERPYYLIGADSLVELPGWRSPEAILEEAEVVVAERPGVDPSRVGPFGARVGRMESPRIDLSSSQIRRRVSRGVSIRYLVSEPVRAYILRKGLYRTAGER